MNNNSRAGDALLAWACAWAALAPLTTLLDSLAWVMPAVVVTLAAMLAGIAMRAWVRSAPAIVAVQLAAGLEAVVLLHGRGHSFYGLPKVETILALNNILIEARETMQMYSAPAPTNRGMIVALSLIALLVVLAIDLLAVTARAPAAAGLALLTAYLITAANRGETLPLHYFLLPAGLWLILLARTGTAGLRRWPTVATIAGDRARGRRPGDPRRAFGQLAARIGAVVLALAVLVPMLAPHLPTRYLTDGLGRSGAGTGGSFSLSTTLDLRQSLESQSSAPALKYRTSLANVGPLRVAVLTDYRNGEFRARPQYPATSVGDTTALHMVTALDEWWRPLLAELPDSARRDGTFTAYDSSLRSPQIAMPYGARYLRTGQQDGAVEFSDSSVEVLDRTPEYEVDFTAVNPTPQMLAAAGSFGEATTDGSTSFADLNAVTPDTLAVDPDAQPALDAVLMDLVGDATTDLERVVAIQSWLRSSEFTYSLDLAPVEPINGVIPDPLTHFLATKQGYCQQFASAMVMLARSAGIPARMAIGFLPGTVNVGEWTVRRSDAHAWPEIYFSTVGWVRFDPTPASRSGSAPAYARLPTDESSSTSTSSSSTTAPTQRPTRPEDGLDSPQLGPVDRSVWQRIDALPTSFWVIAAVIAGGLAALVLPVTSALARRRRLAALSEDRDIIEERWQDLIARIDDLGISTPTSLTPRQVQSHLTDAAVLDQATSAALGRVVDVVEVARYAQPGTPLADPSADIDSIYDSVETSRSPRTRLRARLVPYAGLRSLHTLLARVRALPSRLSRDLRP